MRVLAFCVLCRLFWQFTVEKPEGGWMSQGLTVPVWGVRAWGWHRNEEDSIDQEDAKRGKWHFADRLNVEDEEEGVKNNLKFLSLGDFEDKANTDSYRKFCQHLLIVGRRRWAQGFHTSNFSWHLSEISCRHLEWKGTREVKPVVMPLAVFRTESEPALWGRNGQRKCWPEVVVRMGGSPSCNSYWAVWKWGKNKLIRESRQGQGGLRGLSKLVSLVMR